MKKTMKIIVFSVVGVILCALVAVLIWQCTACGTVYVQGKATELSLEETRQFRQALKRDSENSSSGGFGRFTSYSCGFSEDYAIRIGGLTYCLGQDDCPSVYVAEWDYYYCVSDENHAELHRLLNETE